MAAAMPVAARASAFVALAAAVLLLKAAPALASHGASLSASCGATCGPSFCSMVSNVACTPTAAAINVPLAISNIPCRVCTQSTADVCSTEFLTCGLPTGTASRYGVKAAYCTDAHLIIHSDNTPNHDDGLSAVERPPGGTCLDGTTTCGYAGSCVTRSRITQFMSFKIPLAPVELATADATINNVASFPNTAKLGTIAMPSSGPVAYTVTGMPTFPYQNDQGAPSWQVCEMDKCNAHVGKGFDYHYHGDPFNCLYSAANYTSTAAHPPLIGWGADGFKWYGRYLDTAAPGYTTALDDCGGHKHGDYAYHYHSQLVDFTSNGVTYTGYVGGPYKCWKGDISGIANFWDGLTVAYGSGVSTVAGNLAQRSDYTQLKPCCGSVNYFAAAGVTLNGAGSNNASGLATYACPAAVAEEAGINKAAIIGGVVGGVGGAAVLGAVGFLVFKKLAAAKAAHLAGSGGYSAVKSGVEMGAVSTGA